MAGGAWDYEIFWNETIKEIEEEISEQEFLMWFRYMNYLSSKDSHILVGVPSVFFKDQVTQRYLSKIESRLFELSGQKIGIFFKIQKGKREAESDQKSQSTKPAGQAVTSKMKRAHPQLNTDYNFERFVRGENNDFAYMASYAISKNPGKAYNPCLIYGGVGLGKTHLLQAIGNSSYQEFSNLKIAYVTAETLRPRSNLLRSLSESAFNSETGRSLVKTICLLASYRALKV